MLRCAILKVLTPRERNVVCGKEIVKRLVRGNHTATYSRRYPRITTNKNPSMADESIRLSVEGLDRGQEITMHGQTTLQNGAKFESLAHYVADNEGCVLLNRDKSHGGTYLGIEPMGPLWSMIPSPANKRRHERYIIQEPTRPFIVSLRVYDSFLPSFAQARDSKSHLLAETSLSRWYLAPGTKEYDIRVGRLRGTLYIPPGKGPFPGVITMSGGYPGAMKYKACHLSSYGFSALALKYFGVDDLPPDFLDTNLEYIEEAAEYLQNHPSVLKDQGIGIFGSCHGGTLGLALASVASQGLIKCVATVNSSYVTFGRLRYRDKEWRKPSDFRHEYLHLPEGSTIKMHIAENILDPFNEIMTVTAFSFHKQHDISYLLLTSGDDTCLQAREIGEACNTLFDSVHHQKYEIVHYPDAGHLLHHAFCPHVKVAWTIDDWYHFGGRQPGHERAQEDSWRRILAFFSENLIANEPK